MMYDMFLSIVFTFEIPEIKYINKYSFQIRSSVLRHAAINEHPAPLGFEIPDRFDINLTGQSPKIARGLQFRI